MRALICIVLSLGLLGLAGQALAQSKGDSESNSPTSAQGRSEHPGRARPEMHNQPTQSASPRIESRSNFRAPTHWQSLDQGTRKLLAPIQSHWDRLPIEVKRNLRTKARRWETLPPAEQEKIRHNIRQWQRMSPSERRRVQENRQRFRQLPPPKRKQLRQAYQRFQHMSEAQRNKIIKRWNRLSDQQKLYWLNGGKLPEPDHGH